MWSKISLHALFYFQYGSRDGTAYLLHSPRVLHIGALLGVGVEAARCLGNDVETSASDERGDVKGCFFLLVLLHRLVGEPHHCRSVLLVDVKVRAQGSKMECLTTYFIKKK